MNKIKPKIPIIIFSLILLIGAFLRFYRISEYMTFLGDEGRDVLVVKRIIKDGKFTLLGPITSVGSMYMGPIYYYFMVPFLFLWGFNPVGPAVMVALFSVATIVLLYFLTSRYFGSFAGIISAFFYAISPLPIIYGRSSWNPNIVPFFSLLTIFALLRVVVDKKYKWLSLVGFSLGILIQLHYVTLIFIPIIISGLVLIKFRIEVKQYLLAIMAFLISYSPFLLFELRHGFINTKAVIRFISQSKRDSLFSIIAFWETSSDVFVRLFWRLIVITNAEITKIYILLLILALYVYLRRNKKKYYVQRAVYVILIWLFIGVISFGLYQGVIYDYYFGSLFTAPFVLTGIAISCLWRSVRRIGKIIAVVTIFSLAYFNLKNNPQNIPPNNLLANTRKISEFVFEKTSQKPYNFALIAGRNSDHAYRYFLELWGRPPVSILPPDIDPERKTVTDQLLVICEEKICQPLGHPLWEIAGFGRAEIENQWQVITAKVFRLVPYNN